ncbi:MAG TPA: ATP-binding cassette domain-containing protein [Alphaproteobacteria bacterium]|nr:ATP-binding cassette domain-containing protein [Alphaproteobacteria bacterium]
MLARDGHRVLAGIDATIAAGEFIGVFGPNGAGKTTLLHALLGLLRPAAGEIRIFGRPPRAAAGKIGYLPQKRAAVAELELSGYDFVASAWRGERWGLPLLGADGRRAVGEALATVEAEALARRPLGQLSGGERQRLLLAQALLGDPRLLLLDEPLISLDPRYQQAAVALIKRIQVARGITVLFTAHEINPLLGAMDRVLYLGHGRAALGRVDEVMTGPVLSRLYGAPIDVLRVKGRIVVVAAHGEAEAEAHRHDDDHGHDGHGHHHHHA